MTFVFDFQHLWPKITNEVLSRKPIISLLLGIPKIMTVVK